jgi:hypothetical protein
MAVHLYSCSCSLTFFQITENLQNYIYIDYKFQGGRGWGLKALLNIKLYTLFLHVYLKHFHLNIPYDLSANQLYCKVVANLHYPSSSWEAETFLVCPMRDQGKDHVSWTQNCNSDTEPGREEKLQ